MDSSGLGPSMPRAQPGSAAGGGDEAGNAEQKGRGGRGRAMGRQRLLSTTAFPHTDPRGWELGEAGWEAVLELQETGKRSQGIQGDPFSRIFS